MNPYLRETKREAHRVSLCFFLFVQLTTLASQGKISRQSVASGFFSFPFCSTTEFGQTVNPGEEVPLPPGTHRTFERVLVTFVPNDEDQGTALVSGTQAKSFAHTNWKTQILPGFRASWNANHNEISVQLHEIIWPQVVILGVIVVSITYSCTPKIVFAMFFFPPGGSAARSTGRGSAHQGGRAGSAGQHCRRSCVSGLSENPQEGKHRTTFLLGSCAFQNSIF